MDSAGTETEPKLVPAEQKAQRGLSEVDQGQSLSPSTACQKDLGFFLEEWLVPELGTGNCKISLKYIFAPKSPEALTE